MPSSRLIVFAAAATLLALASKGSTASERWVPERCIELAEDEASYRTVADDADEESATQAWNRHYRTGFGAIEERDFELAERQMCIALVAARAFAAADWRFAETLDELGLIYYSLGDLAAAEWMQGAAVAEILLVRGPSEPSDEPPSCREPSVELYRGRLGIVYKELEREDLTRALEAAPYKIFELGYLPLSEGVGTHLDGLVSDYLRREDLEAADYLRELLWSLDP